MISSLKDILSGVVLGFDTGIAKLVGVEAATVFNHIVYWLKYNVDKDNDRFIDGKVWMYETQKQMADFFEFLSEDQISRIVTKLVESGLLIKGNFNKNKFDRTSWYTVADQSIIQKKNTKPQNCGMQYHKPADSESASPRNDNRTPADSLYTEEHPEEHLNKTTTKPPPKNPPPETPASGGGGGLPGIYFKDKKGITQHVDESSIYRYFCKHAYPTPIIQEAITEAKKASEPIGNIFKYLEAICDRLVDKAQNKKQEKQYTQTTDNEIPKASKSVNLYEYMKQKGMSL